MIETTNNNTDKKESDVKEKPLLHQLRSDYYQPLTTLAKTNNLRLGLAIHHLFWFMLGLLFAILAFILAPIASNY